MVGHEQDEYFALWAKYVEALKEGARVIQKLVPGGRTRGLAHHDPGR